MESKVIFDEARDEEVAVVVALLQAKLDPHPGPPAGLLQQLGLELRLQERVVRPLVD